MRFFHGRIDRSLLRALAVAALVASLPGSASAQTPAAEAQAARAVEDHKPVDPGTEFAAGDTVYVWSRVTDAADTKVQHVWKRDGNPEWTANLAIRGRRWSTQSRRKCAAGNWVVEVLAQDGSKLTEVSFAVK